MKSFLLVILIIGLATLQSCQIEHVDKDKIEMAKKRQAEKQKQRKAEQKRKKKNKKDGIQPKEEGKGGQEITTFERLPTPAFEELTASRKQTLGAINQVNGVYVMMKDEAIKITGDSITIKGTAIDRPMTKAPAGAFIRIGANVYPVDNWTPRKKYADKAKNPDYLLTGFKLTIPTADLEKGTKFMTLLVVSSDRENYYTINEKVKIII